MFPIREGSDQLSSTYVSFNPNENLLISEDLILSQVSTDDVRNDNNTTGKGRRRKLTDQNSTLHNEKRKVIHREIERQRRQEMTHLFVSLRSLLPLEFIKGKRSIPDHINEAVRYIILLKKKIEELEGRRNEKKFNLSKLDGSEVSGNSKSFPPSFFTISPSCGGIEIVISSSDTESEGALPVSRVMKVLLEQGLGIFSCISTKVNANMIVHTIQSEVCDFTCIDQNELQQRLSEVNLSLRYMTL
ncbi:Basic helix-loop-helix transcription factor [Trema orientale]|uniref:Basic helix-loop-helix transcription factor n=1 Tax=Trema orientale TaxID=63057 RepID=A0A2P5ER86_TREOI|nr:Basic helix-loop-helix transcription factor [Trema orientale]